MNNFLVTLTVNDCCISKCCVSSKETTKNITNFDQFIPLQNGYYIKVLMVSSSYIIFEISNGIIHYIRRGYVGMPFNICLNESCPTHKVSILVDNISNN